MFPIAVTGVLHWQLHPQSALSLPKTTQRRCSKCHNVHKGADKCLLSGQTYANIRLHMRCSDFGHYMWYAVNSLSRVTHICVNKLTTIGSDNNLSLGRRQTIIETNAAILLFWPLWTNFSEISIETHISLFKNLQWKMRNGGHLVSASMC